MVRGIYTPGVCSVPCYNISFRRAHLQRAHHVMFYVNSKYVLLTYAQCGDLDEWNVNDHLSTLGAECIIARELHQQTGGVHLHVFVDFGRKFRSRNVRVFDVDGRHPNVSPSRGTPEKGYDYAIKDGDVVAGGLDRPRPRGGMHVGAGSIRNVKDLCENAGEFLEVFDELDPGTLIKSFGNVRAYADWKFAPEPEVYQPPYGVGWGCGGTDGRAEWLLQSGIGTGNISLGELPLRSAIHIFGLDEYFYWWAAPSHCLRRGPSEALIELTYT